MADQINREMPVSPVPAPGVQPARTQVTVNGAAASAATAIAASVAAGGAATAAVAGANARANGANGAHAHGLAPVSTAARITNGAAHPMATAAAGTGRAVLEVRDLKKHFPIKKGLLRKTVGHVFAVDGVSFTVNAGETLGLVGESGCGKTTVGRTLLRLVEPTSGQILLDGRDVTHLPKAEFRPYRREMQIIFQDPFSSLDPRMSAGQIVGEPLMVHKAGNAEERRARVAELFGRVGLRAQQMDNFPHQFSGGQRQRLGIARALALNPKLIIGDEPVSALDVSIQAQVINILMDLQKDLGLSYLFISHNLAVVEHISHRIAVMYLGRIVEYADKKTIFTAPRHPYTEALLSAVPVPDPSIKRRKVILQGDVPSPVRPPPGCHFHTRCPIAEPRCKQESPKLREAAPGQLVACHLR